MTTGGPTWPAENGEEINVPENTSTDTSVEQTRYIGKQCRKMMQQPDMQEKIQEYLQKRISEEELKKHFQRALFDLPEGMKRTMGLESDTLEAMQQFLSKTGCFNDIFLYEINHNKAIKESAREQMMDMCVESADADFELTDENKKSLRTYLAKENDTALVNFLETHRARKIVTKRAIKATQLSEKTLQLSNFDSIHNKIANLDPTRGGIKRIQSAWNTLLGGFNLRPGEDVHAAFARIRENGTEWDLSADYQAIFGPTNTCMSEEDKNTILSYLVGCLTPTVSYDEIVALDSQAAKTILGDVPEVSETTSVTDAERKEALIQYRKETAQSLHAHSYTTSRLATKKLDRDLQIKILGTMGSRRRIQSLKEFSSGRPGNLSTSSVVDFEKSFLHTYQFNPDDISTDEALAEKLQTNLGNKIKNIEKFGRWNVMMWRKKGANGQRDMVGYYAIDSTQGENSDDPGEIQMRFLGNNTSVDPNNPYEKGRLTPGGIVKTFTGPQFFDYLMGSGDDVTVDFVEGWKEDNSEHPNLTKQLEQDQVRFYSEKEVHAELRSRSDATEIYSEEVLNEELDNLLYQDANKTRESEKSEQRHVFPGMVFALHSPEENKCDTFQIEEVIPGEDGQPGMIRIWDGWGSGEETRREMTFLEFINVIKWWKDNKTYSAIYRIPGGKPNKNTSTEQFNMLMSSQAHNSEGGYKKNKNVCIQEGKLVQMDATGAPIEKTIIKIKGGEKDLQILSINWDMVEVSQGTFTQAKYDEKKGKARDATFKWSAPRQISLTLLWSYLQNNSWYELDKPVSTVKPPEKDGNKPMSWFNIFAHSHSLWVLLHGDLWKAPFKAWEEQHHKDHAFHGKLTAALAIEKLQSGKSGPIGAALRWAEWPSLMVANSNNSFQSYLDELVNMIDGMWSKHRTNLIKKWARSEHFPSAKFMAAMFASMHNFGQLYPYDDGKSDPRAKDSHGHQIEWWFWYNSIVHSVDPSHSSHPHMPPHGEWPKFCRNKETGEPLSEIEACQKLFQEFKHPMLTNLGRRFQKYMNKGHENLKDGGKMNMEQRVGMEARLDWMMNSIVGPGGNPTEIFGAATDIWLAEWYPTEYSTMPYMAMMIGQREQQLLPMTQTHAKELFQSGNHVPMFVFCQNKALGDTFRETSIAFAYTISNEAGKELEDLCKMSSKRLDGDTMRTFKKQFETFWKENGKKMMHKLTGMRDPMLNLMINAPETFKEMLEAMPEGQKKKDYQELKKRKRSIRGYYDRLQLTYDSPSHVEMPRWKAFYTGDHFRFRDGFDVGYPMAWVNWDAYWDSNMDDKYASGGGATSWDGIFNEIRWFLYKIPKMAEAMADDMGFKGKQRKDFINKISNQLYHKNIDPMKRLAEQEIKVTPESEYCSMTAMMFGIIPVQEYFVSGSGGDAQARYKDYFNKISAIKKKADSMQESGDVVGAIKYRDNMATTWSKIVKQQINVGKCTIEDIEKGRFWWAASTVRTVTSETLEEFESKMRPQGSPIANNIVPFHQKSEEGQKAA